MHFSICLQKMLFVELKLFLNKQLNIISTALNAGISLAALVLSSPCFRLGTNSELTLLFKEFMTFKVPSFLFPSCFLLTPFSLSFFPAPQHTASDDLFFSLPCVALGQLIDTIVSSCHLYCRGKDVGVKLRCFFLCGDV